MKGIRMKYKLYQKNSFSIIRYLILLLSPLIIIILIKFDKVFYEWRIIIFRWYISTGRARTQSRLTKIVRPRYPH